jgi:hypothetical protein
MADSARCLRWEAGVALNQLTVSPGGTYGTEEPRQRHQARREEGHAADPEQTEPQSQEGGMTARKQTKTGARKPKKLGLNKETLKNLTPGKAGADAVKGGWFGASMRCFTLACTGPSRSCPATCDVCSF